MKRDPTFSQELDARLRHRREDMGPRRVDCAREGCGDDAGVADPWYLHASQVRTVVRFYEGDCGACAGRGRRCDGYITPKAALIADEPEIPDEAVVRPTPASIATEPAVAGSDSHATTSPPNFQPDSHPHGSAFPTTPEGAKPEPLTAGTASCFTHGDFDPRLARCPLCAQPSPAEIAGRLK